MTRRSLVILVAAGLLAAPAFVQASDPIVLMTWGGTWQKAFEELAKEYEQQTRQPVRVVTQATAEVGLSRLKAQAGRPEVDLWTSNPSNLERAIEEDLLQELTPELVPNLTKVPERLRWREGVSAWVSLRGIFYRKDLAPFALTKWEDLWDARLKDKIAAPAASFDPGYFIIMSSLVSGGSERNVDPGFAKLRQLKSNITTFFPSNVHSIRLLEAGEVAVVAWGVLPNVYQYLGPGSKYAFVIPKKPVFVSQTPIAIAKGTPRLKPAAAFVNWVLAEDVQTRLTGAIGAAPANRQARAPEKIRDIMPSLDEIYHIDWRAVTPNLKPWADRYNKEVQTR